MSIPNWFDYKAYFQNKLTLETSKGSDYNDALKLQKAFIDAGYPYTEEGMYQHYLDHGEAEGVGPNNLFHAETYLYNKASQWLDIDVAYVTPQNLKSLMLAIEQAGLTPMQHYLNHWAENFDTATGTGYFLNPSNNFDVQKYMEAKLAQMQQDDPDYTMSQLVLAFQSAELDPLTHYFNEGVHEGLSYQPSNEIMGETKFLENGEYYGTAGNDMITAKLGVLDDHSYIDGGAGRDTLLAYLDEDTRAIRPEVYNVEKVVFSIKQTPVEGGGNPNAGSVSVDAGKIRGMDTLVNDDSRATLVIEDIRTDSDKMTVSWKDADPSGHDGAGNPNLNYEVYFNPQNLTTEAENASGNMVIKLMDVVASDNTDNGTGTWTPLLNQPWEIFYLIWTDASGTKQELELKLDKAKVSGATATYDTLRQAFEDAIKAVDPDNKLQLTVTKGDQFYTSTNVDGETYASTGDTIVIASANGKLTTDGWGTESGKIPPTSGIVSDARGSGATTCPLIVTNIHLDNVGRVQWGDASDCLPDNAIFGSESGNMIVGSQADRGGIEKFEVTVDRGSWLTSLASTNNQLRVVVVKNGAEYNNKVETKETDDGNHTQLFIGQQLGNGFDSDLWGPASWTDKASLLATNGLEDVKLFDASGFDGNVNIGARITQYSYDKYLKDVDNVHSMDKGVYAPDGDFQYNFGAQADILNMSVAAGVAVDQDFLLNIDMGAGNDLVNFFYNGGVNGGAITNNQILNMAKMQNVVINGGDGNDIIRFWGDGAITVNGDGGDDAIYVGQLEDDTAAPFTEYNAVFVFNSDAAGAARAIEVTDVNGAQPADNNVLGTTPDFTFTGTAGQTVTVRVSYGDIQSQVITLGTISPTGSLTVDATFINQQIAIAVAGNKYLNNLFEVKDGAGYSLLIEALFDGVVELADLNIDFAVNNSYTAAGAVDANAAYNTEYAVIGGDTDLFEEVTGTSIVRSNMLAVDASLLYVGAGEIVSIVLDGVTYQAQATAAITSDADLIALLNSAESVVTLPATPVALNTLYDIQDNGAAADGQLLIGAKSGAAVALTSVSLPQAAVYEVPHAVDSADAITVAFPVTALAVGEIVSLTLGTATYSGVVTAAITTDAALATFLATLEDSTGTVIPNTFTFADVAGAADGIITITDTAGVPWTGDVDVSMVVSKPVAVNSVTDPNPAVTLNTGIDYASLQSGDILAVTVDGITYKAVVGTTPPTNDAALIQLLNAAEDAAGTALNTLFDITNASTATDGILTLTPVSAGPLDGSFYTVSKFDVVNAADKVAAVTGGTAVANAVNLTIGVLPLAVGNIVTMTLDGVRYSAQVTAAHLAAANYDARLLAIFADLAEDDGTVIDPSYVFTDTAASATTDGTITIAQAGGGGITAWGTSNVVIDMKHSAGTDLGLSPEIGFSSSTAFDFDTTMLASNAGGGDFAITIDNQTFYGTLPNAGTDANWATALSAATLDGVTTVPPTNLGTFYNVSAGSFGDDGIIRFSSVTPGAGVPNTIELYEVHSGGTAPGRLVTGTDTGTNSHNIVNGGTGDDTIVLNVGSYLTPDGQPDLNDIVVLSGTSIGKDVIANFDFGIDQFDISAYNVKEGTIGAYTYATGASESLTTLTAAQIAGSITVGSGNTGIGFVKHGSLDTYTVFQYNNGNNTSIAENEIVNILGTVTFVNDNGGVFTAADIVGF